MRLGFICLLCLVGCASAASKAGLEGDNPLVRIVFSEQPFEPFGDWSYSLDNKGNLTFIDKLHKAAPNKRQLDAGAFREIAIALAPYRQKSGGKRKLADDCRSWFTDIGSQQVEWIYLDGSIGHIENTNCTDGEAERFGDVIVSIRRRLDVNGWRVKAMR